MSEKRYKKYKFIKKQQMAFIQNQMSFCRVEESNEINSPTIDPINSQAINNLMTPLNLNEHFRINTATTTTNSNTNYKTTDDQNTTTAFRNLKLLTFLKTWSIEYKINHSQLSSLLKGLKDIFPEYKIPRDARSLLKTKRSSNITSTISKKNTIAQYTYFGIKKQLLSLLGNESVFSEIKETFTFRLIFNIDGIPVAKSSNKQFWPILCKVILKNCTVSPFPIKIYYGDSKPNSLADYLHDFVNELNNILECGLLYDGNHFKIRVICFTCDAPARAFLKNIKGHTGFNGCERCTEKGTYYKRRVVYMEHNASARTHSDFESFHDIAHHRNNERIPLLKIINFDIIKHFSLDYMHLCCLGVMKKLLHHWCTVQLSLPFRNKLSKRMVTFAKYVPCEFNRTARPISELHRYKATEFRLFLLYLGPVVLKQILPNDYYEHFLLFHVAIRILLHTKLYLNTEWLNTARQMLLIFVNKCSTLYGKEFCIFNIHNLVHITDDVENLKYSLEELSCFPFENYLGILVSMLRRWNKPLAQIINRLSENDTPTIRKNITDIIVKTQNNKKSIEFSHFKLKAYGLRDCYVFLKNGHVLQITDILENTVCGRLSSELTTFYKYPIISKNIGIFKFNNFLNNTVSYPLSEIVYKAFVVRYHSHFVAYELLHLCN